MSREKNSIGQALALEIRQWEDYLMNDLRERILKNGGKALSERQLKKTTNGDITYERMVRVIGRGNPDRLRQVVARLVQEVQNEKVSKECFEKPDCFERSERFEKVECFEDSGNFEDSKRFEPDGDLMKASDEKGASREAPQLAGVRKRWDKMSLLSFLRGKYRELGRMPGVKDIAEWSKKKLCPSYPTCMKLLEAESKAEWGKLLLEGQDA